MKRSKSLKSLNDAEKQLPVKRTSELTKAKPRNGYKDNGVKEFVEDNENGKEDFESLLEAFIAPVRHHKRKS